MTNFHQLTATSTDGHLISMDDYAGKVVLVVNTASQCGFTPQYAGLEALYTKYASQGLVVLGFPCNQFGKQEPGGADEISKTCYINYGVSFPMFEKVEVNGGAAHPVFRYLKKELRRAGRTDQMEFHEVPDRTRWDTPQAFCTDDDARENGGCNS